MKSRLLIAALVVIAASTTAALADVPAGYYATLNGKSGQALKNAIHELTKVRTVHNYGSLWYYFRQTDAMTGDACGTCTATRPTSSPAMAQEPPVA